MIDMSVYAMYQDQLDHTLLAGSPADGFGSTLADSGPVRRLQVLFGEARAAGMPWATFARILIDWVRAVEPSIAPDAPGRDRLMQQLHDAESLRGGKQSNTSRPFDPAIDAQPVGWLAEALDNVIDPVAYSLEHGEDDVPMSNIDGLGAWYFAGEALSAIFDLGGDAAIERCAEIAYRHLFAKAA